VKCDQGELRTNHRDTSLTGKAVWLQSAGPPVDQQLRASELSYRRLFEAAKDGILILEADTGRISDVNPFLTEMLGYSRGELVGRPLWELGPFKDIASNQAKFEQLQQQGYVRYDNLPLEARDGRHHAVEFVSNVYQAGDHRVIQCNIRDITGRAHAQERIRQLYRTREQRGVVRAAELTAANQELEAFSYSVSHDLRAPLRHVVGFVKLLEKDAGPALSEKSLEYLTTISQAAKQIGTLIEDLLAFARLGHSELQKTTVDLDQLVKETVTGFQAETDARKIVWEIQPLPVVQGDRALLHVVLVNLLANAVKFTGPRAAPRIEIGYQRQRDGEMVFFVRDNGVGFNPQYANKLFGVFQRLHTTTEFEGTGIGLATVQRIIQRHGGRTWAEGAVGSGATFYFSLPN